MSYYGQPKRISYVQSGNTTNITTSFLYKKKPDCWTRVGFFVFGRVVKFFDMLEIWSQELLWCGCRVVTPEQRNLTGGFESRWDRFWCIVPTWCGNLAVTHVKWGVRTPYAPPTQPKVSRLLVNTDSYIRYRFESNQSVLGAKNSLGLFSRS